MVALVMGGTLVSAPAASTWHVAPNGSDANNGTSWAQAWATISNAVAQAVSNDTILVSNGTYAISAEILLTNTALTIQGYMNGVYGGLSVASNTIIKRAAAGAEAPQHRIFNISGNGGGTNILDGLTITNGYLDGLSGGGIYGAAKYIMIRSCIIAGNTATNAYGGGIYFHTSTWGTITNSTVAGNFAKYGGGIELNTVSQVFVLNCLIRHNTSINVDWNRAGGGMEIFRGTGAYIYDCTITSNYSGGGGYGGGIYCNCAATTPIVIDRCLIQGNTATIYGGGIVLRENPGPPMIVRNSRIIGNTARYGGGISLPNGGAYPTMVNNLIADNTATTRGGAVYGQWIPLLNCTLVRNSAVTYGGIYAQTVNIYATNTIVYANSPDTSFGLTNFANSCSPSLTHGINGNTTNDPQFVLNTANGDYRLGPNSPCVNTGTNQAWMTTALDLDGKPRVDRIIAPIVDMGAYEYHPQGLLFLGR